MNLLDWKVSELRPLCRGKELGLSGFWIWIALKASSTDMLLGGVLDRIPRNTNDHMEQ